MIAIDHDTNLVRPGTYSCFAEIMDFYQLAFETYRKSKRAANGKTGRENFCCARPSKS